MRAKEAGCQGCPLFQKGGGFALTDGKGTNGVLIVLESLGADEVREGLPAVGPTGQLLNRIIRRSGMEREDFLIANVVNCQPPGNALVGAPYEKEAIAHCAPYLQKIIRDFKPRAILTLGNTPLRWFTGRWGIEGWRGYVVPTEWGPVVPSYHPSYLLRGNLGLARVLQHDLQKAVKIAAEGHKVSKTKYLLRPTPGEAFGFLAEYERRGFPLLAFDIETPYSGNLDEDAASEDDPSYNIERISFSFEENTGITMPWMPPFTEVARRLLASSGPKCVYNEGFDVPRLVSNDAPVLGRIYDTMWAWHLYQPEWPYGLKYAATFLTDLPQWKSESKALPEYYSVVDSDALLRVHNAVKRGLEGKGQWETFERHVVDLSQVLRKMSRKGVLVSLEQRALERVRFQARYNTLVGELTRMVPQNVLPRKVYKISEEALRKKGIWDESRMVCVGVIDVKETATARKLREKAEFIGPIRVRRAGGKKGKKKGESTPLSSGGGIPSEVTSMEQTILTSSS